MSDKELTYEELLQKVDEKLALGNDLINTLKKFIQIPGVERIQRKINQEIKFLQKVIKNKSVKIMHIQCSNLTHYEFLVNVLQIQQGVLHIDCGFRVSDRDQPLRVDIVCANGLKWIKVIARNFKSLMSAVRGDASYGVRSILDQAEEYLKASEEHLCMFKRPKVIFYFSNKVEEDISKSLLEKGIEIGLLEKQSKSPISDTLNVTNIDTLNLDITTLLAYVSNVCNGGVNCTFKESLLNEQAVKERETPLKITLDQLFHNKRLICCNLAFKSFSDIVALLGGPKEKYRAEQLAKRIEILPDINDIPKELSDIKFSSKINQRSLRIFAFGMHMKAVTVTSNKAFVRSAKMQGINIPVFTHQARALTEAKELY